MTCNRCSTITKFKVMAEVTTFEKDAPTPTSFEVNAPHTKMCFLNFYDFETLKDHTNAYIYDHLGAKIYDFRYNG